MIFPCDVKLTFPDGIDGWHNNDWGDGFESSAGLSHDPAEQALVLTPNWHATDGVDQPRQAMYVFSEGQVEDVAGASVGFVLNTPHYYVENPGMVIESYVQQDSGDYAGVWSGAIELSEGVHLGGGHYRFEVHVAEDPRVDPNDRLRVGVQLLRSTLHTAGEPGENILLREVTIRYATDDPGY